MKSWRVNLCLDTHPDNAALKSRLAAHEVAAVSVEGAPVLNAITSSLRWSGYRFRNCGLAEITQPDLKDGY